MQPTSAFVLLGLRKYRRSAFVILFNCSNLAVIKKVTAKQSVGILNPNSTNAWPLCATLKNNIHSINEK
jgi:hypothetical protein